MPLLTYLKLKQVYLEKIKFVITGAKTYLYVLFTGGLPSMKGYLFTSFFIFSHAVSIINAVVTCEIKSFQNYFRRRRHPPETALIQRKPA